MIICVPREGAELLRKEYGLQNLAPQQPDITITLRPGPKKGDNLAKLLADTRIAVTRFEQPNVYKSPEDNPVYGT
jgi:hypothetical protein